MSGSFFAGAWRNHQFPQSVFNGPSGALPPKDTSGYANGLNAQADARINYNSTLLGDLAPYAYGKPGRLSSQTAFLAIPHMLQKVVPVLSLPSAQFPCQEITKLYHAVDDGDVAFTINIDRNSKKYADGPQIFDKVGALRAIDPFCNLVTVNYLLAGIQLFSDVPECTSWVQFIRDIGMYNDKSVGGRIHTSYQIIKMIRDVFIPFGVPRGSDMQGGQTQGSNAPNIYPVDHVTSMLLDGKCINIINIWKKHDISAGDDMILVLRKMVPNDYVLSRQTGSYNRQRFTGLPSVDIQGKGITNLEDRRKEGVWQLVPWVYNMNHHPPDPLEYDYRENGYWHISKALQMYPSDPQHQYDNYNDATKYRRTGELMEVSFQPLFIEGLPDGSSKRVIKKRDGYPEDKDDTGIAPMYDYITGRVILQINDEDPGKKNERNLALTGAGPPSSVWRSYLKKAHDNNKRKHGQIADEFSGDSYRRVLRRTLAIPYGNQYINEIPNAAEGAGDLEGEVFGEMEEMNENDGDGANWGQVARGRQASDKAARVAALGSEAEPLDAPAGVAAAAAPAAATGAKKGGKRTSKSAAAAAVAASTLSGSYLQNSGIQQDTENGGSGGAGAAMGSVRASLLSNTPTE